MQAFMVRLTGDLVLGIFPTKDKAESCIKSRFPHAKQDLEGDYFLGDKTYAYIDDFFVEPGFFDKPEQPCTATVSRLKAGPKQFENERIEVTCTGETVQAAIAKARLELAIAFGEKPSRAELKKIRDQIDAELSA